MKSTSPAMLSGSNEGEPITVSTVSQTLLHTSAGRVCDIILHFINETGGASSVTISIEDGADVTVSVPANSILPVGPFSFLGTVLAQATVAVKVIGSVRVADSR